MRGAEGVVDKKVAGAIQEQAREGALSCAAAFRIAKDLGVAPLVVGQAADARDVRLGRCQLGLFGYGKPKSIVKPAEEVSPELEQAIREGLILGRLPCPVVWAIAVRFGMPKMHVANAAEKLEVRIGQCQLGAF
jgi:hypothetical protein